MGPSKHYQLVVRPAGFGDGKVALHRVVHSRSAGASRGSRGALVLRAIGWLGGVTRDRRVEDQRSPSPAALETDHQPEAHMPSTTPSSSLRQLERRIDTLVDTASLEHVSDALEAFEDDSFSDPFCVAARECMATLRARAAQLHARKVQ